MVLAAESHDSSFLDQVRPVHFFLDFNIRGHPMDFWWPLLASLRIVIFWSYPSEAVLCTSKDLRGGCVHL